MVSIINFVIVKFNLTLYLLLCNLSRFDSLIRKQFDNPSYFNWTKGIFDPSTTEDIAPLMQEKYLKGHISGEPTKSDF